MNYEAISFDAAGTLIDVNWRPELIAVQAAQLAGISIEDPQVAAETYGRLLQSRWGHFQELNLQRSREICDEFWRQLGEDWLTRLNLPTEHLPELVEAADTLIFGSESAVFRLFDDTLSTLDTLRETSLPLIILSNWDVSLHRTCEMLKISVYFTKIIASLEEGVEKPEPALFQVAQDHLKTNKVLHIGDDPMADVHGARKFGWDALLLDRNTPSSSGQIQSLGEVINFL